MAEKLPIHYYQLSSGQWTLIEFQAGEVIPISVGGTGTSSLDGIKETIGLFSSSTSGLVSSVPLATSAYTLMGNGWRLTSTIVGIESISSLRDTNIGSPTLNQVLTWNGTKWTQATPPGATGGEANTGSNIGGGPGSSFDYKLGVDLRFRTLSGVNLGVSTVGDLIQLSATPPIQVSSVDSAVVSVVNANNVYDYYLVNTTTTGVTLYLPAASANTNKVITISKVDDSGSYRSVTVSSSELVTATNTILLYDPTESVRVISNGTSWYSLDYDRSYGVVFVCKNSTGSTLTKGTPVRVSGATGANILVSPTSAFSNHIPAAPNGQLSRCIGVVEHDIPNGEFGHILTKGILYKFNTNSYNEGDQLYLAASGGFTNVKPTAPYEEVFLGVVTRKQSVNGSILIDIVNPTHLNDIVGINLASSISNNDLIVYNSSTSTFTNIQPSTILSGTAGEANTASNIGGGPGSSFSSKVGVDLRFRTLSGVNLNVSTVGDVILVSGSTGGVIDHGALTGLEDNDHPQYVLSSTNATLSSTVSSHIASSTVHFTQAEIDHGAILGLADNDHPQYVLSSTNNALSSLVNNHIASAVHWDLATLNSNYINSSGDSANAAFYFQTLSSTTISATNYLNVRPNVSSVNSASITSFTAGGNYDTYLINTTTTSVTAYLPEASSYTNKMITFSKVDDGGSYRSVTISGTELVTATNTVILYDPTESVTVISNGTNWYSLDYDRAYGVVVVCKNSTGATLTKGTPVKISGATGANVLITAASAANNHVPQAPNGSLSRCIGVVEHDIPTGEFGHVLTKGVIYKYNTNGYNEGDQLYLSPSGGLTNVKPTPPYDEVFIGVVTRKQAINGSILIDIANPIHINDIVGFNLASSISNRDLIAYDLTTSTFKNYAPSSFNVSSATSATLAYSSTYALSSTSALNAQQAPNGFTVTGTLAATTVSATTYENLGNTVAKWNASAIRGITVTNALPDEGNVLTYNAPNWVPAALPTSALTATSATSALNAQQAPNGFSVTGTLAATTVSATNYLNVGAIDHGLLSGLGDNDHPQYVLSSTNSTLSSTVSNHIASSTVHFTQAEIDHGVILGLSDNDHPQYVLSSTNATLSSTVSNHIAATNNPHSVTAEQVGNTTAQWNASAIRGSPLSATLVPTTGQSLVYNGTVWTASSVAGGGGGGITSINSQTGAAQTISAASGLVLSQGTDSITLGANYTSAIWNASALVGYPISSTLTPAAGQALMYNGSQWTASAALFAYTYGSGAPTGGSDGDIYLQTDVNSLQIPTVSATTYLNLPSGTLTWTYATSATSALNAQQAPNGFSVTGNLTTTSGDVSAVKLTDYSESKSSPSISSSSLTLDLNAAQVFTVTLNSNISSLTISNTDSRANTAQGFTLILTADGTARTITWPGSVKWPSGTGPTLTSTNNKVDILSFVSPDNGTTWYGFIGGQNY
jgi:predicted RecA/RadA family phage recombinase